MKFKSYDKQISILDWVVLVSIAILFIMVYLPQSVWMEENKYKTERRNRMEIISQAEDFYYELTKEYTSDFTLLASTVEKVFDEQFSDSLFRGIKEISIQDMNGTSKKIIVNIEKDFHVRVDTTFSKAVQIKETVIDTIYSIGMLNEEKSIDTINVHSKDLERYKNKPQFVNIYSTNTLDPREENNLNYLKEKFHLNDIAKKLHPDDSFEYCPISKNNLSKKFIIEIDNSGKDPSIKIISPLTEDDREWRYGIFRYKPGRQEVIEDGMKSWSGK